MGVLYIHALILQKAGNWPTNSFPDIKDRKMEDVYIEIYE